MAVAFLLLAMLVQAGTLVMARHAASAAAAASARRAAVPGADLLRETELLHSSIERTIPGARDIVIDLEVDDAASRASVSFRWNPPGPMFGPLTVEVVSERPTVVPP